MMRLLGHQLLNSTEKVVLLYISHPEFVNRPTNVHAKKLWCNYQSFRRAAEKLEALGYIRYEPRTSRKAEVNFNRYEVTDAGWELLGQTEQGNNSALVSTEKV